MLLKHETLYNRCGVFGALRCVFGPSKCRKGLTVLRKKAAEMTFGRVAAKFRPWTANKFTVTDAIDQS